MNIYRIISLVTIIIIFYSSTLATIIEVPDDFTTIQAGINASTDGDTVLVQPGTYVENINFNGHNIVLGSLFLTTEDTNYISQTVIDGDSSGSVVTFENSEDSTTFILGLTICNGLAELGAGIKCANNVSCQIKYNIIRENMPISTSWANLGSGIYCLNSGPQILHNSIENNGLYIQSEEFYLIGGGIYYENSNASLESNIISGNCASRGGVLYCENSNLLVQANTINNNFSYHSCICTGSYCNLEIIDNMITYNESQWGSAGVLCPFSGNAIITGNQIIGNNGRDGSIRCDPGNAIINNNSILNNNARTGGGIKIYYSSPDVSNNLIMGNSAITQGGGIFIYRSTTPLLNSNVIAGNSAGTGGGIYMQNSIADINNNTITQNFADEGGAMYLVHSSPNVNNTICWNDSAGYINEILLYGVYSDPIITFSDIEGGWPGEGNIYFDPLFVDPENGDFHLLAGSPCIDAGDPASPLDPDSTRADMGAFYYDQQVDINVIDLLPSDFHLHQNYPNPFNASTTIDYNLPHSSDITIDVYDVLGRKVASLIDRQQPAGYHQVLWQTVDLSSGVYFYKLQAGGYIETKKMLLVK